MNILTVFRAHLNTPQEHNYTSTAMTTYWIWCQFVHKSLYTCVCVCVITVVPYNYKAWVQRTVDRLVSGSGCPRRAPELVSVPRYLGHDLPCWACQTPLWSGDHHLPKEHPSSPGSKAGRQWRTRQWTTGNRPPALQVSSCFLSIGKEETWKSIIFRRHSASSFYVRPSCQLAHMATCHAYWIIHQKI